MVCSVRADPLASRPCFLYLTHVSAPNSIAKNTQGTHFPIPTGERLLWPSQVVYLNFRRPLGSRQRGPILVTDEEPLAEEQYISRQLG